MLRSVWVYIGLGAFFSASVDAVTYQNLKNPTIPISEFLESIEHTKQFVEENEGLEGRLPEQELESGSISLAEYQTSIKDQQGRGTCWAFAGAAALEAAYKREYGVSVDLSSQYIFHIQKAGELYGDYATNSIPHENNSSYWGFQGNSGIVFHMMRFAVPTQTEVPYLSSGQMDALKNSIPGIGDLAFETATQEQIDSLEFDDRHIPTRGRWNAKYRITSAVALPNLQMSTLESVLRTRKEILTDVEVCWRQDARTGIYHNDSSACSGGHVFLVIGFDSAQKYFLVKNSWGGSEFLKVGYDFFEKNLRYGTYITGIANPNTVDVKAKWLGKWNMDHDGWRGSFVIRRFTDFRNGNANAATKLGNYYRDGKRYDVNGYFTDDGRHMVFHIADTEGRVVPGTLRGQGYNSYIFSWDAANAAGVTTWNNIPFGVYMSRASIPGSYSNRFEVNKWVGTWHMNHDGWRGDLTISRLSQMPATGTYTMTASYRNHQGRVLNVTGNISNARPHVAHITIDFAPDNRQSFQLYHHTWENGVFSGLTQWNRLNFGVQGSK